jgi:hypothetical protein
MGMAIGRREAHDGREQPEYEQGESDERRLVAEKILQKRCLTREMVM